MITPTLSLEELIAEVEGWHGEETLLRWNAPSVWAASLRAIKTENDVLHAIINQRSASGYIEQLEEALEFYANPDTYFAIGIFPDRPCGEFIDDHSDAQADGWDTDLDGERFGKRARDALKERQPSELKSEIDRLRKALQEMTAAYTHARRLAGVAPDGKLVAEALNLLDAALAGAQEGKE